MKFIESSIKKMKRKMPSYMRKKGFILKVEKLKLIFIKEHENL